MGQVFRSGREAVLTAATGIVLGAVLASHSVVEHRHELHVMSWELATAAAACLVAYRFFMAGAYATDGGLRLVNPFRSVTVPWGDIERFSIASYGRWPVVAIVELKNGTRVPIVAIRAASWRMGARRMVEQIVQELERIRSVRQDWNGLGGRL
ncbi:MAG: PH domain-containing protein [Actinomycetota bacterium]